MPGEFHGQRGLVGYCPWGHKESDMTELLHSHTHMHTHTTNTHKLSGFSHVQLFATPWTVARQAPLSMEFSRQEYWSGLSFPSPGNLPDPGIEPESLASPELSGGFFTTKPPGKPPTLATQSCLTLCDQMDYSPPGSSVHEIS